MLYDFEATGFDLSMGPELPVAVMAGKGSPVISGNPGMPAHRQLPLRRNDDYGMGLYWYSYFNVYFLEQMQILFQSGGFCIKKRSICIRPFGLCLPFLWEKESRVCRSLCNEV